MEKVIVAFIIIIAGLLIGGLIVSTNMLLHAPCEELSGYAQKDLPARCIKYYAK